MKKIISLIICVLMGGLMMLTSCSSENLFVAADEEVAVTVNCESPRGWDIAKYSVTATDALGNVKTSESSSATLSIKLKKGVWSFVVSAFDSTSTELYKGSKDSVDLSSGTATSLSVMIIKRSGSVALNIKAYEEPAGGQDVKIVASKTGFDDVIKITKSFSQNVEFADLAQGAWTFTISVGTTTLGTVTGNVTASALITLTGTYSTTTTTSTTTTVYGGGGTSTTVAPPVEGDYYWTNKSGHYGTNKTISSLSDWTESEKIVQGAANDDPRAFLGYHEKATDFYALYAAYDDTKLYLMVEMPSIDGRDITSKDWQYALDENLGMGVAINTGKGVAGDGEMDKGITPWNAAGKFYSIQQGVDVLLMFHPSEYGTPGFFKTNSSGKFSYDKEYCLTWTSLGVSTSKEVGLVSSALYGRSDNYGLTEAQYLAKTDYVDMLTDPQKSGVTGYKYQITIPLTALNIDKAYIQSTGIGVMVFSTFGTSMMDALPWCSALIDAAAEPYSQDPSTSHEKEDVDVYDVPLARVGK